MPLKRLIEQTQVTSTSYAASNNFAGVRLQKAGEEAKGFSFGMDLNINTPAADSFATTDVNIATDEITLTAHGMVVGLVGQFTTTGTLPAGLSLATNYYIIVVDANTVQVASSLANAQAGTQIDITSQGTGTHTFTPTTAAGIEVKLQGTVDDIGLVASPLWVDITNSEVTISASDDIIWDVIDPMYSAVRAVLTLTSGQVQISLKVLVKG